MKNLSKENSNDSLTELKESLKIDILPKHIECFDISHTMGENTIASCVVFNGSNAIKNEYRYFNITNIQKGDDIAAMEQALKKRYKTNKLPEMIMLDGGKAQLKKAQSLFKNKDLILLAIAKGKTRKPGMETIHLSIHDKPIFLDPSSNALHLLQKIRDEAHRFAITNHKKRRLKNSLISKLENISGIGIQKRKKLIECFGDIEALKKADVKKLIQIKGINELLAKRLYDALQKI